MTMQNYLMVNESTNVVENCCVWDGNPDTWQPPTNTLMLVQATTPALVWESVVVDKKIVDFVLVEQLGVGAIGFTWNGSILTTNEPKPPIPEPKSPIPTQS